MTLTKAEFSLRVRAGKTLWVAGAYCPSSNDLEQVA